MSVFFCRTVYYSLLTSLCSCLINKGRGGRSVKTHNNQIGEEGKDMFFLFLLFLLCLILILYPNFLFVLAVLDQIGEKGNGKFILFRLILGCLILILFSVGM